MAAAVAAAVAVEMDAREPEVLPACLPVCMQPTCLASYVTFSVWPGPDHRNAFVHAMHIRMHVARTLVQTHTCMHHAHTGTHAHTHSRAHACTSHTLCRTGGNDARAGRVGRRGSCQEADGRGVQPRQQRQHQRRHCALQAVMARACASSCLTAAGHSGVALPAALWLGSAGGALGSNHSEPCGQRTCQAAPNRLWRLAPSNT